MRACVEKVDVLGWNKSMKSLIGELNTAACILLPGYNFISSMFESLSQIQAYVNETHFLAEIEDLHLWIRLLHEAHAGILIHLVVKREPNVLTRPYTRKRVMGVYTSQGIC